MNTRVPNEYNFEIEYRTPKSIAEIAEKKAIKWSAACNYRITLDEIKQQPTPGKLFRDNYLKLGKQRNVLISLDNRMIANLAVCVRAVTALQSHFRGNKGKPSAFKELQMLFNRCYYIECFISKASLT